MLIALGTRVLDWIGLTGGAAGAVRWFGGLGRPPPLSMLGDRGEEKWGPSSGERLVLSRRVWGWERKQDRGKGDISLQTHGIMGRKEEMHEVRGLRSMARPSKIRGRSVVSRASAAAAKQEHPHRSAPQRRTFTNAQLFFIAPSNQPVSLQGPFSASQPLQRRGRAAEHRRVVIGLLGEVGPASRAAGTRKPR